MVLYSKVSVFSTAFRRFFDKELGKRREIMFNKAARLFHPILVTVLCLAYCRRALFPARDGRFCKKAPCFLLTDRFNPNLHNQDKRG